MSAAAGIEDVQVVVLEVPGPDWQTKAQSPMGVGVEWPIMNALGQIISIKVWWGSREHSKRETRKPWGWNTGKQSRHARWLASRRIWA